MTSVLACSRFCHETHKKRHRLFMEVSVTCTAILCYTVILTELLFLLYRLYIYTHVSSPKYFSTSSQLFSQHRFNWFDCFSDKKMPFLTLYDISCSVYQLNTRFGSSRVNCLVVRVTTHWHRKGHIVPTRFLILTLSQLYINFSYNLYFLAIMLFWTNVVFVDISWGFKVALARTPHTLCVYKPM